MKIIALILSLTVLTLSVAPQLVERTSVDMHQTCENSCDGDGCCDACCSPFHACGSCHGFTIAASYSVDNFLQDKHLKLIPYTHPHYSAYAGDIWQPPKLITN
ncbi:hypothetical protein AGMMS49982_02530 [Bacteroidia bacterium]|nr:hypothetical protein AGMMS49982_02530 [Bacteroidia bacterium]